jgi:1-acyl-sn-glycerol-3-phosphate acyltransferase
MDNGYTRIDVKQVLANKAPKTAGKIPGFVINYLIRTIHQNELNDILSRYRDKQGTDFMEALLDYFDLKLETVHPENIPDDRRCIFASNHPLGGLDGICLSAILGKHYKGRFRCLVNDLLLYIPNLRSIFNQILTFPAGLCSRKIDGKIQDVEWKKSFISKAVEYQRDVVPVFYEGRNSSFFYRIANIRRKLGMKMNYEMIYLPDEMFKLKHTTFRIHFGKPISWHTFNNSRRPQEWAQTVRESVYNLTV